MEDWIRNSLQQGMPPQQLASQLALIYFSHETSQDDQKCIINFLWVSQSYTELLDVFIQCIQMKLFFSSTHLMALIGSQANPRELTQSARGFVDLAKLHGELKDCVHMPILDSVSKKFSEWRQRDFLSLKRDSQKYEKDLIEKLAFARSERILDEEKRILKLLRSMRRGDDWVEQQWADFELRWARELIERHRLNANQTSEDATNALPRSSDELLQISALVRVWQESIKDHPQLRADLAIGLVFIEAYAEALEFIPGAPADVDMLWLKAEVEHLARRYIDCLSTLHEIESRLFDEPEAQFSAAYMAAQCYYGLGHKARAIELIDGLIAVKPNYRDALGLRTQWTQQP